MIGCRNSEEQRLANTRLAFAKIRRDVLNTTPDVGMRIAWVENELRTDN